MKDLGSGGAFGLVLGSIVPLLTQLTLPSHQPLWRIPLSRQGLRYSPDRPKSPWRHLRGHKTSLFLKSSQTKNAYLPHYIAQVWIIIMPGKEFFPAHWNDLLVHLRGKCLNVFARHPTLLWVCADPSDHSERENLLFRLFLNVALVKGSYGYPENYFLPQSETLGHTGWKQWSV